MPVPTCGGTTSINVGRPPSLQSGNTTVTDRSPDATKRKNNDDALAASTNGRDQCAPLQRLVAERDAAVFTVDEKPDGVAFEVDMDAHCVTNL